MVQLLETSYGATAFLPALKSFLHDHLPHNTVVPSHHDRFDVFRQVIITAPADQRVGNSPKRWRIRATPEVLPGVGRKPGSPARFDMVLVRNGIHISPNHSLHGTLLFFCISDIRKLMQIP